MRMLWLVILIGTLGMATIVPTIGIDRIIVRGWTYMRLVSVCSAVDMCRRSGAIAEVRLE